MEKLSERQHTPPKSHVYHDVEGKYYSSPMSHVEMLTSQSHYLLFYIIQILKTSRKKPVLNLRAFQN